MPPSGRALRPAAQRGNSGPAGHHLPWGTLSREDIIRAALRTVRAGGYEQLSVRSLAAELGVAPMSLYRHVRDKDDLLDEVVDRLLARVWRPGADPADWRGWIGEAANKLRHFLVAQPAALHVYLNHPVVSPAAAARMDAAMDVLRRALGDDHSAQRAYAAVHTYTVGFATLEASRSRWQPPEEDKTPGAVAGAGRGAGRRPVSESPDLIHRLAAYTTPDQFRQGLDYLLDGIERDAGL